jgi:hypothetical protein
MNLHRSYGAHLPLVFTLPQCRRRKRLHADASVSLPRRCRVATFRDRKGESAAIISLDSVEFRQNTATNNLMSFFVLRRKLQHSTTSAMSVLRNGARVSAGLFRHSLHRSIRPPSRGPVARSFKTHAPKITAPFAFAFE